MMATAVATTRLERFRAEEFENLTDQLRHAIQRLTLYRQAHPEVNALELACYPDGSFRGSVDDTGGFVTPTVHMWRVGKVTGLDVYIYETVNWEVWKKSHTTCSAKEMDTGEYKLAVSDPSISVYGGRRTYIRTIKQDDVDPPTWSLDAIITMTDLLGRFYNEADATDRNAAW